MTYLLRRILLLGSALLMTGAGGQTTAPTGFYPALIRPPGDDWAQLLGAAAGGRWLTVKETVPRLKGQEKYGRRSLGGPPVTVVGGKPESYGEPCEETYAMPVKPINVSDQFQVFTAPALNAQPRPVTKLPTNNETYRQIVRTELIKRGIQKPNVQLVGLTRTDLDGNGTQEVIIEATHYAGHPGLFPPPMGQPGDYSIVLLRHVVGEQVLTLTLGVDIAPLKPGDTFESRPLANVIRLAGVANVIRLAGIADLNGDGRMELILYGAYYEGSQFTVSEWTPARGLTETPMGTGCGV